MNVDRLYVICCRADVWFARICVASIRYWYPQIPITLVKDETRRKFDTSEIERLWNLDSKSVEPQFGGWAMAHFDLLFNAPDRRYMFLDSDIVFIGPVLGAIEKSDGDLVVSSTLLPPDAQGLLALQRDYYNLHNLQEFDPEFRYPGLVFNCGAMVTGAHVFRPQFFGDLVKWFPRPTIRVSNIFQMADQGLLNYITAKMQAAGQIRISSVPFMLWSRDAETAGIPVAGIERRDTPPKLIHWAGDKPRLLSRNPRSDILQFFENEYYKPLGIKGGILRWWRSRILWVHQVRTDIKARRTVRSVTTR